jgi:hypothetical protein
MKVILACSFLAMAVVGKVNAETTLPIKTSLCEIDTHPNRFIGKLVKVYGSIKGGFHGVFISDNDCRYGGAALEASDAVLAAAHVDIRKVSGMVPPGKHQPPEFDLAFVGTVVGRVVADRRLVATSMKVSLRAPPPPRCANGGPPTVADQKTAMRIARAVIGGQHLGSIAQRRRLSVSDSGWMWWAILEEPNRGPGSSDESRIVLDFEIEKCTGAVTHMDRGK